MVNETEVKLGIVAELEGFERCIVGIIRAPFWYRQMKELDRPVDASGDRVGHLDHYTGVPRLHHVLVGRAAVAQVITELDGSRHRVANLGEYIKSLGMEVDRAFFVAALPSQHLLTNVPLDRELLVRNCRSDFGHLIGEVLGERGQETRPVRRHHVVVGGCNRGRQTNLKLHAGRYRVLLLHAVENGPGFDRHVGITGFEFVRVRFGLRLEAQTWDFAQQLSVPLGEAKGRDVSRKFDRWVLREHVL